MAKWHKPKIPRDIDDPVEEFTCHWYNSDGSYSETSDTDWKESLRQDITGPIARLAVVKTTDLNEYI